MLRFISATALTILLPLACFAQMNYTNNGNASNYSIVEDVPNCGPNSCWHAAAQEEVTFGAISVGSDGYLCGITPSGGITCHAE